jgi:4-hydroxy-tetrahydrodipicolinate synthase
MVHQFHSGNLNEARKLQLDYLPLIQALFKEPNPIPVKGAVNALGFDVGMVRLPLTSATDEVMEAVLKQMRLMGITVGVAV